MTPAKLTAAALFAPTLALLGVALVVSGVATIRKRGRR